MNLNELKRTYEEKQPILKDLAVSARYRLQQALEQRKIKVHELIHRIKELDSLREKAERRGVRDPLRDIHDVVGLRVVCLFRSDVSKVLDIVRESFDVVEEENKEAKSEKWAFEYMATHVIARMRARSAGAGQAALVQIPFEIQVRTIGQDAWASLSHHLAYKQETSFPPDHLRDLHALSALFYLADIHFEFLKAACTHFSSDKSTRP